MDGSRLAALAFALALAGMTACAVWAAAERGWPQRYFVTAQWPGQFLGEAWCLSTWLVSEAVCVARGQAITASPEVGFKRAAAPTRNAMISIVRVLS